MYIHTHTYTERERFMHIYIYIYIYTGALHRRVLPGLSVEGLPLFRAVLIQKGTNGVSTDEVTAKFILF